MKRSLGALLSALIVLGCVPRAAWAAGLQRGPQGAPVTVGVAHPTRLPPAAVQDAGRSPEAPRPPVSIDLSAPVDAAASLSPGSRLSEAPSAGAAAVQGLLEKSI